jgi:hypothetical protein
VRRLRSQFPRIENADGIFTAGELAIGGQIVLFEYWSLTNALVATQKSYPDLPAHRQSQGRGHTKTESTVRYLGIEVDDALAMAEQVDV